MLSERIQAIRGMNDILPEQSSAWQTLERVAAEVFQAYGYQQIRMPIVERTELFRRSIGEVTDIVEKEMYTFADRGGDSLSLRPEGTVGAVRACIEHGLLHNQMPRLWYTGPMFRYERPQKGRYRRFHQLGAELLGLPGPDVDAELIMMSARLWQRLEVKSVRLQINSLGTPAARHRYRELLVEYFQAHHDALDEDSQRRLHRNPMRILDSKNPDMQALIVDAPALTDHLDTESDEHLRRVLALLDAGAVDYEINPRLVRGLDYYTRTVFEWTTDRLGAQDAVCAGGRYDGLVEQLGGRSTPGIGFAIGMERLIALMQADGAPLMDVQPHVYFVHAGDDSERAVLVLAERLRDALPALRLLTHAGGGGFKTQFKRADRSGARFALILGEDELASGCVQLKPLRSGAEQESVEWDKLAAALGARLGIATADRGSTGPEPAVLAEEH